MIPCIVTIRKGKKRRCFFFLTGSFSMGIKKEDDLIVCHSGVFDRSIKVSDGKVVRWPADTGNGNKAPGGPGSRRIFLGDTEIRMTYLQLKFFLPIAIILGTLLLAGPFMTPTALPLQESHDMVIRPSDKTGPVRSWGIRDIRIGTSLPKDKGVDATKENMEKVRSILESPMAGGWEISRCYLIVRDGIRDTGDPDSRKKLESMRTTIEGRLQALLKKTVIKSRSLIASGQISKARREMDNLKAWVPGTWMDGKRELDEAENMFN